MKKGLSRRDFMKAVIAATGSLISLVVGIPAVAYILGPSLKTNVSQKWVHLGPLSKIALGTPTLFRFKITHQTGWVEEKKEESVYVVSEDGREFLAMSNICTHLGCRVRWDAKHENFPCPCHNGFFDKQGNVISGPPPRPLDIYASRVEDEELYIEPLKHQRPS